MPPVRDGAGRATIELVRPGLATAMPARASDPESARAHSPAARSWPPPRPGPVRRAAEPLAWWSVLLACYLALVSTISGTEITVGAAAAAAGAAAAVAGRRALLTTARACEGGRVPARSPVAPSRLLPPLGRLPAQIVADTARIAVRGASGGRWTTLSAAPGPAGRGVATLLVSTSPGTYVGGVDPGRGLLRVHRLAGGPSPFERRLHDTGLVGEHGPDGGEAGAGGERP